MASSSATSTSLNNPSNSSNSESALYEYMRQFVDYQENGVTLNELSQIRQLDIYLQSKSFAFFIHRSHLSFHIPECYDRVQELVTDLRNDQEESVKLDSHFQINMKSLDSFADLEISNRYSKHVDQYTDSSESHR